MSRTYLIIGGSLTGNKGAASMVLGIADGLRQRACQHIGMLTSLPEDDAAPAEGYGLRLIPYAPWEIVLSVPSALVYRYASRKLPATTAVRAFAEAAVVADVSGISFSDGRGLTTLIYNVLLLAPALILGTPVVKVAQAMGPFKSRANRTAASLILPRVAGLLARGAQTEANLISLGIRHDGCAADSAFLLSGGADPRRTNRSKGPAQRPLIALAPSQVLADRLSAASRDYGAMMVALVNHLTERGDVVLVPHSARPGKSPGRINDLPLCQRIEAECASPSRCTLAALDAGPLEYRRLFSRCALVVTSRFHGMVSALAVGRTPVVAGWGHKYREVLDDFDLADVDFDLSACTIESVILRIDEILADPAVTEERIRRRLPSVIASAERNLDLILKAASE